MEFYQTTSTADAITPSGLAMQRMIYDFKWGIVFGIICVILLAVTQGRKSKIKS